MSQEPRLTGADVLALFQSLLPDEQRMVREVLLREDKSAATNEAKRSLEQLRSEGFEFEIVESYWVTLGEVAADLKSSKSQVSRLAKAGKLWTNGKSGRHLRIFDPSVGLYALHECLRLRVKSLSFPQDPDILCQIVARMIEDGPPTQIDENREAPYA